MFSLFGDFQAVFWQRKRRSVAQAFCGGVSADGRSARQWHSVQHGNLLAQGGDFVSFFLSVFFFFFFFCLIHLTNCFLFGQVISPPSFADVIPLWARKKNAILPTWGSDTSGAQVLWRKRGIKHTPNEIYLDVHEHVDAILDAMGKPISLEVFGEVMADVALSDMPDLTLVFKNSRVIGDVGLHNCVRYKRWEAERVIR